MMKSKITGKFVILVLALSGVLSLGAFAQTTEEGPGPSEQPSAPMEVGQGQPSDSPDAPPAMDQSAQPTEAEPGGPSGETPAATDQGVGRISLIHGDVSTQRGDSGDWSAATLNQPLMTGDKISTADDARAEVQLDYANTLRLGPNTKANIGNLTKQNIQIQLAEGILNYSLANDSQSVPEIDTPNVSIHPAHHDGVFRVEVRPDGDTVVIVRQGEAQIATPQGSTEIHAGDMATIRGDADSVQYKIASAPDRDDWDRWNGDRDHIIRDANSWRHTNRRYTGAQDLDAYGTWKQVPDYGDVWVPNEPDGWVPYRNGNWVWEPYYGWTWVGYEPWGWAPYHYGRWFWYGSSWAWWPGPVYAGYNPFWAPAYVSFWGWGGGFGFGVGFGGWGGFGWLPLGPCDWFHPWWGGYRGRFGFVGRGGWNGGWGGRGGWGGHYGGIAPLHNGIRFSNVANIRDGHIGHAMSAMNAGHFGAGRVGAMAATRQQIGGARMMAGNLPVVPTRASLSASGRAPAAGTMRNGGAQRFFGSTHNNMRPASFQQQTSSLRQSMQQNHVGAVPAGGRFSNSSFSARASSNMRPSAGTPAARQMNNFGNRAGNNSAPATNRGGYNSFGTGNRTPAATQQGSRGFGGQNSGFRPFTPPSNSNRSSGFGATPQHGTSQAAPAGNRSFGGQSSGFRPFTPPSNNGRSFGSSNPNGSFQRGTSQAAPGGNRSFGGQSSGFRPFTPPSSSQMQRGANSNSYRGNSNGGSYWNRTAPSSMGRSYGSYGGGYGGGSRPQLDMRQPIVRSPSYGGSSRGAYSGGNGGYRGSPSYGGGGRSYGGGGGGGRSYGGGGGGGGHFSGGGGGGGHSGGGGGGGHSGGGGHGGHR